MSNICLAQKATVLLNNYDANNAILWGWSGVPVPLSMNFYVELWGGPSASQLQPVVIAGTTTSRIKVGEEVPGFFDGGVGVVPGVTAGATARFKLRVFSGNDPGVDMGASSALWTQVTGSWDDRTVPPSLASGPVLQVPSIWFMVDWPIPPPPVQGQNYIYTTNNNAITITRYTGSGGGANIPDTIDGLPVTSIGDGAFIDCFSLTSVTIPNSVTSVGDKAFESCASLTSITIPNSVTNIGVNAFAACTSLTSVTVGSSVTSIGDRAFAWCARLTAITVDTLNPTYSSVGGVLFDKSQTTLLQYPADKAESYTISNSVTRIGNSAFSSCDRLTSVTIGNSVTSIGDGAFCMCYRLTSVTIPDSVTSIGDGAFSGCTNLTAITVDALNPTYSSVGGVLFDQSQTTLLNYPAGKAGSYAIPNSVSSIGNSAFGGCLSLTGVTIPNSVTSIGKWAFDSCAGLRSVTIPNSVTRIGDKAFIGCHSLTSVTIPNSVTSIGDGAFCMCYRLTSVTIPNSVTTIGESAFAFCIRLAGVYFQGNAPRIGADVFGNADEAIVYYLPGTAGWGTSFGGCPTMLWNPPQTRIASVGVGTNQFGFSLTGSRAMTVVVEACTNLANPIIWVPLGTNTLTSGSSYFSDPQWTNYPSRFYRLRSP